MSSDKLPDGWTRVKFGDVVRNVNENSRDLAADGLDRVVGLDHLDPGSLCLTRWDNVANLPDGTTFTRKFKPGQVLFGKRRAYQRKVAVPDFEGVCSGDILVFEPSDNKRMLADFLPYLAQSDGFFDHALGTSAGSLSPRTKWAELAKYEFALPPLDEQRRIAELLKAADVLVDRTRKVDFEKVRSSLYRSTDPKSGFIKLSDAFELNPENVRNSFNSNWSSRYVDISAVSFKGGIDLEQVAEIDSKNAPSRAQRVIRSGDVLVSTVRPELRGIAVVPEELDGCVASTGFTVIRASNALESYFVRGLVKTDSFTSYLSSKAIGTSYPAVKSSDIADVTIKADLWANRSAIGEQICAFEKVESRFHVSKVYLGNLRRALLANCLG